MPEPAAQISANARRAFTHIEHEILVLCCRQSDRTSTDKQIKRLLRQKLDWPHLIECADRHGVLPLLYWRLKEFELPNKVRKRLQSEFLKNARKNIGLTGVLIRVFRRFQAAGISAIPFRGPVLAASVYGRVTHRRFTDLDILVRRQDLLRAKEVLVAEGFEPKVRLSGEQERAYLDAQLECILVEKNQNIIVELHWAAAPRSFSFPLPPRTLWEDLVPVALPGVKVFTLSPANLLLILCAHGTKHLWRRLCWICDVAALIQVYPQLDVDAVLMRARRLGGERMVGLGLYLANDLLGAPLPGDLLQRVQADSAVVSLTYEVYGRLFREDTGLPAMSQELWFFFRARERLQDRIRCCLDLALSPSASDWTLARLPPGLTFMHYFFRPFRLMVQGGLRGLRRILQT